jgi:leader peptidase (prepilin peptidase)/N-methyltransferase
MEKPTLKKEMQTLIKAISSKLWERKVRYAILCTVIWIAGISCIAGFVPKDGKLVGTAVLLVVQLLAALNDIKNRTISPKLTIPALFIGTGIMTVTGRVAEGSAGATAAFVLMILLVFISRHQIGGGDVMLMTVTGMYVGIAALFSILFGAVILAGVYSLSLIFTKRAGKKTEIPFAPFILTATAVMVSLNYLY